MSAIAPEVTRHAHETPDPRRVDLTPIVGANVRRLRTRRGLSLERLSQASGVSRAMLGQIENGQSAPSVNVLWRVAQALEVSLGSLVQPQGPTGPTVLRRADAKRIASDDGAYLTRPLFPVDVPRRSELHEVRLRAAAEHAGESYPPGTTGNLVVCHGQLEIVVGDATFRLEPGDAVHFDANVAHHFRNALGDRELVAFLSLAFAETVG
jgi:transcriptional regulator with XRE-family HTH domain